MAYRMFILVYHIILISFVSSSPTIRPARYNGRSPIIPHSINSLEEDHVHRAMVDVAATIAEVQKILETDPTLPRLTRGEIEELFENVTKEEFEKSLRSGDNDRARHMKALMLVLPYNTNNDSEARLQELYTRPPITKVIQTEYKPDKIQKPQKVIVSSDKTHEKKPTTYNPGYQKATTFHPRPVNVLEVIRVSSTQPPDSIPSTVFTSTTTEKVEKFSSHYSADRPPHPNIPQRVPIRENVKDLLATIGLTQEIIPTTTKKPELTPELRQLLESFGLLTNEAPPKHLQFDIGPVQEEFQPISPTRLIRNKEPDIILDSSASTPPPPPPPKRSSFRMNTSPEVTANDFYAFKPLPIPQDSPVTNEMQEFLQSFGLYNGNYRSQKAIKESITTTTTTTTTPTPKIPRSKIRKIEKMPPVNVDFLSKDLLGVLGNIGIQNRAFNTQSTDDRSARKLRSSEEIKTNSILDNERLDLLLDTIKNLEYINRSNLTDDELNAFYKKLASLDPLKNPENIEIKKNDFKRQSAEMTTETSSPIRITLDLQATTEENSNFDNASIILLSKVATNTSQENDLSPNEPFETTTKPIATTPTTTTTEEPRNSLNLEETFGAGDLDPVTETPLPSPRPNGFYFLADWNSFLEVGEDPDKVIVRFDPKIGDPSRFIPVHVP